MLTAAGAFEWLRGPRGARGHGNQGRAQGDWVQKFSKDAVAALFATAQFSRYYEVEAFLLENFSDKDRIIRTLQDNGTIMMKEKLKEILLEKQAEDLLPLGAG
jgi:hypothetical protein